MIEAIITGIVAIVVCMINNLYTSRATKIQHEKTISLIDYQLQELQKKVEKHNNIVERTYKLEELTAIQEEKIKVANHRIEDLENQQ